MRASYQDSLELLRERVEISGDAQAQVSRPPRHDDDELGPSIFRLLVEDVDLSNLTVPGLFIGRSDLRRISFRGSDLHFAALNWSDVAECDFSGADLSGSDLRACRFVRCQFRGTDLTRADLRGSTFEGCAFEDAAMQGAILRRRPALLGLLRLGSDQESLPLSPAQRAAISWSADEDEPGGG